MAVCQNLVPPVDIKIAGKWMFIPLKMVLIGIDPYPYNYSMNPYFQQFIDPDRSGTAAIRAREAMLSSTGRHQPIALGHVVSL